MPKLLLFVEDDAQEKFIGRLLQRIGSSSDLVIQVRSSSGGWSQVVRAVKSFNEGLKRGREVRPDVVCIAADANCKGLEARRKELAPHTSEFNDRVVLAIADPHIERWLLLDGEAFKSVLGRGCAAPDQKCEKNRYKRLLVDAVREAGVKPMLGGIEYAEEIAAEINLDRASQSDVGFRRFIEELNAVLTRIDRSTS